VRRGESRRTGEQESVRRRSAVLMHMPTRWGAVVIVVVAACVGAYYALAVRPGRVEGWEIYQGSGRIVRGGEGPAVDTLDVTYRVANPAKPLFSYRHLASPPASWGKVNTLGLTYRAERDTTILVVVTDDGGAVFQAKWKLQHSDVWRGEVLGVGEFEPRSAPVRPVRLGRPGGQYPDFGRMAGRRVDFYDGSGVVRPSNTFSNRLELLPPELLRQGK
jgi:hypothetical protein